MMKDNILGISSVVENMSDYASFDEEETDDSDIKIYGAEQKAAETEADEGQDAGQTDENQSGESEAAQTDQTSAAGTGEGETTE